MYLCYLYIGSSFEIKNGVKLTQHVPYLSLTLSSTKLTQGISKEPARESSGQTVWHRQVIQPLRVGLFKECFGK